MLLRSRITFALYLLASSAAPPCLAGEAYEVYREYPKHARFQVLGEASDRTLLSADGMGDGRVAVTFDAKRESTGPSNTDVLVTISGRDTMPLEAFRPFDSTKLRFVWGIAASRDRIALSYSEGPSAYKIVRRMATFDETGASRVGAWNICEGGIIPGPSNSTQAGPESAIVPILCWVGGTRVTYYDTASGTNLLTLALPDRYDTRNISVTRISETRDVYAYHTSETFTYPPAKQYGRLAFRILDRATKSISQEVVVGAPGSRSTWPGYQVVSGDNGNFFIVYSITNGLGMGGVGDEFKLMIQEFNSEGRTSNAERSIVSFRSLYSYRGIETEISAVRVGPGIAVRYTKVKSLYDNDEHVVCYDPKSSRASAPLFLGVRHHENSKPQLAALDDRSFAVVSIFRDRGSVCDDRGCSAARPRQPNQVILRTLAIRPQRLDP